MGDSARAIRGGRLVTISLSLVGALVAPARATDLAISADRLVIARRSTPPVTRPG